MGKVPRILLITGMPGSGKEEIMKIFEKRGMRIIRMGDFVREETKSRGLKLSDENVGNVAQSMREEQGFDIWARKTIDAVDDRLTVVDGVRGRAEVELFKNHFGDEFAVIAVNSSPKTRFKRLIGRKRADAPKSFEEFEKRDIRELRWGLGDVIARADYIIDNESSLKELERKVVNLCEEIQKKRRV